MVVDIGLLDTVKKVLREGTDMTIATLRPDGFPQATTVSYVSDGIKIYFGTGAQSQKAQNLTRDSRVSLTVNLPYADWDAILGISMAGRVQRVEKPKEMQHLAALMTAKFPDVAKFAGNESIQMALFRVDPSVVSLLDYSKGFGHTDLLTLAE